MATPGVRVDGARKLRATLTRAGVAMEDMKAANAAVAAMVATGAAKRAPRRSGRLAGSVRGNRAKGRATVLSGRASVPYAGPIHWGWPARNIAANPFMSDAAIELEPVWVARYTREVENIINQVEGA